MTPRSLLFVPGDRPERFDKAAASGAHIVVLDLEDAVAPGAKDKARDTVADWLAKRGAGAGPVMVRINAVDTPWHAQDLAMLMASPGAGAMLPKADAQSLPRIAPLLQGRSLIALLETVAGYADLRALARVAGLTRIAFGSVDFAAETRIADEGEALTAIRTQIVLECCHAGLQPPIDGISLDFEDEARMRRDALRSRHLGFGGKLCIHPRQVAAVNGAWLPTPAEQQWAQRVLAAFETSGGGATAVDGKMIDKPVVERARQIVAEAVPDATAPRIS